MKWNAADYAANSVVQQSWARELIARLHLRGDERILDVGCGDGKVTAELARAVPRGSVTGTDASAEMIAFAKKTFPPAKVSNLKFEITDARKISFKTKFDLVFSNAALHWVDDHEQFLHGAAAVLKPGGRLVVSCGGKGNAHDVFLALRPEMRLKRWREFFRKMPMPYFFYAPGDYEKWLPKFGFPRPHPETRAERRGLQGRGRFGDVAAHDLAAIRPARAGKLARGIHRRRHAAIPRQASAGCGRPGSRPHGAVGNRGGEDLTTKYTNHTKTNLVGRASSRAVRHKTKRLARTLAPPSDTKYFSFVSFRVFRGSINF